MKVTAWNNGLHHKTGVGYGLKVNRQDRNRYFYRSWESIFISLPGRESEIEVNINKAVFWKDIPREMISKEIGRWLIDNGYVSWPSGYPPKFTLLHKQDNHFILSKEFDDNTNQIINDVSDIDVSIWENGLRILVNDFQVKRFSDFSHFRKC